MKIAEVWQNQQVTESIDVVETVRSQLHKMCTTGATGQIQPGQTVAIAVGSRGITSLKEIVTEAVVFCRQRQLKPFLIPAMGSHGGATEAGQINVLKALGIDAAELDIEIRAEMDVEQIGSFGDGEAIYMAQAALRADHLLLINRIKPHTRFTGQIQSGLLKMLLIGLGKKMGAAHYHRLAHHYSLDQLVQAAIPVFESRLSVWGGIAIIENAVEEVCHLQAVPFAEFLIQEPELLQKAEAEMARLPFKEIDLLIVDEIGKEISGTGMDTNVIGRKCSDHHSGPEDWCQTRFIYVRGLTAKTAGNATGIGMAEFTNPQTVAAVDWQKTTINSLTAGHPTAAMSPVVIQHDRAVVEAVRNICGDPIKLVHLRNTLQLVKMYASEAALSPENLWQPPLRVSPLQPLEFDAEGRFQHKI